MYKARDILGGPEGPVRRVAVVGSGAAGLAAAFALSRHHAVTLFEKGARFGGHCNTVDVACGGRDIAVDTGFIVFNERNYPELCRAFEYLGVTSKETEMSFSVSIDRGRFEYAGRDIPSLLAQPLNVMSPRFWRLVSGIVKFYRTVPQYLEDAEAAGWTLGELVERCGANAEVRDNHLLPMAAAIWSAPRELMLAFPAASFIRFFQNHNLFDLSKRPKWRTVAGGSREYVRRIVDGLADARLNCGVEGIRATGSGAELRHGDGKREVFDEVVIAAHADQALKMLDDPTGDETRILGSFAYQRNEAVLHRDPAFMPVRRRAWASWNYLSEPGADGLSVTYWMNSLQSIDGAWPLFVSLNPGRPVNPDDRIATFAYDHPVFDAGAVEAQGALGSLQGRGQRWYCGSYFGYGFHEDAFASGLAVARRLGAPPPWESGAAIAVAHPGYAAPELAEASSCTT